MIDKALITQKLGEVLKVCECGKHLERIAYVSDESGETVICYMRDVDDIYKVRVNVTADSGAALILDVVNKLI